MPTQKLFSMAVTYLLPLLICDVCNVTDHMLRVHFHIVIMSFCPIFHSPKSKFYQIENQELGKFVLTGQKPNFLLTYRPFRQY